MPRKTSENAAEAALRALQASVAPFRARRYYEVHDILEDPFRDVQGPPRRLLQGLIQVAVALYHHEEGRSETATVMLRRSLRHLDPPPRFPGAPALESFVRAVARRLVWLETGAQGVQPPVPDLPAGSASA